MLHQWGQQGIKLKAIRCDNAGENKWWETRSLSADWKLPVAFEYTAARTRQQNSKVEVGFAVIANRGRALMAAASVPVTIRRLIWNDACGTATLLDSLMVVEVNGVKMTRYEHWFGKAPTFIKYLRTWGEAGVVKIRNLATGKEEDRGVPCMFVGYATQHPDDTFRMYNPATGGTHEVRDVTWLRRMFYQKPLSPKEFQAHDNDAVVASDDNDLVFENADALEAYDAAPLAPVDPNVQPAPVEEEEMMDEQSDSEDEEEENQNRNADVLQVQPARRTRFGRVVRERDPDGSKAPDEYDEDARMRQASQQSQKEAESDSDASVHEAEEEANDDDDYDDARDTEDFEEGLREFALGQIDLYYYNAEEIATVGSSLGGGFGNTAELKPLKYNEAMAGPDKEKWDKAVLEEYERFMTHKAVKAVPRDQLPKGIRVMDGTWAGKKKSNGLFRARMNLLGFKQVNGKHYDEDSVSSPVANIITIHIVLALIAIMTWHAVLVDVRGAFLLGDWESERQIYMEVPQGWEHLFPKGSVLKLPKTVYGAKQSAKRFWIKLLNVMDVMSFRRSDADPCLYIRWHPKYFLVIMISWMDDMLICGTKAGVEETKNEFSKHFEWDDTGEMR
jgi:hypothetical protein